MKQVKVRPNKSIQVRVGSIIKWCGIEGKVTKISSAKGDDIMDVFNILLNDGSKMNVWWSSHNGFEIITY